jgi:hypothetical protein
VWCRRCKVNYSLRYTRCPDCDSELRDSLISGPEDDLHSTTPSPIASDVGREFETFEFFYTGDGRRRGDDVLLAMVSEDEEQWRVAWVVGTGEVAAFSVAWTVELDHYHGLTGQVGAGIPRLEQPPEVVRVLGCFATLEEARNAVAMADHTTLSALSDAMREARL